MERRREEERGISSCRPGSVGQSVCLSVCRGVCTSRANLARVLPCCCGAAVLLWGCCAAVGLRCCCAAVLLRLWLVCCGANRVIVVPY